MPMFLLQKIYVLGVDLFPFTSIFQTSSYSNETSSVDGEVEMCMLKWYLLVSILLYSLPDALPHPPPPPDIKGGPSAYKTALVK